MKINAAAYIRVSTDDQTEYSPAAQLKALEDYARRNNMTLHKENIFRDEGISGRSAKKRPAFMKMIATAKKYKSSSSEKPFDVILVHKFDRFSRNREESIVYKSMLRRECGVKVISITEHIEDDKFSVILEAMLEAMAEYYSLNLADEVKKGMTEKANRGEFMSTAPLGYKWNEGQLIVDESEAKYIRYIFDSFIEGKPKSEIVKTLNAAGLHTHRGNPIELRTVDYILKNIIYKGYTRWSPDDKQNYRLIDNNNAIIKKGVHPPIISEQTFDRAQELLRLHSQCKVIRSRENHKHWLSGMLKCSACGASLSYTKSTNSFQCYKYSHGVCTESHSVVLHKVETAILSSLSEALINDDLSQYQIIKTSSAPEDEVQIVRDNIKKHTFRMSRLKEAYLDGILDIDEYKTTKKEEQAEIDLLQKQLENLTAKQFDPEVFKQNIKQTYNIITSNDFSDPEKNIAIKHILQKIIYNKKSETFEFYYIF